MNLETKKLTYLGGGQSLYPNYTGNAWPGALYVCFYFYLLLLLFLFYCFCYVFIHRRGYAASWTMGSDLYMFGGEGFAYSGRTSLFSLPSPSSSSYLATYLLNLHISTYFMQNATAVF